MAKKKGKSEKGGGDRGKILLEDAADSDPDLGAKGGWQDDIDQHEDEEETSIRSEVAKLGRKKGNKYGAKGNVAFSIDQEDSDDDEDEDEDEDLGGGEGQGDQEDDDQDAIGTDAWGKKKKYFYGGNPNEEKWERRGKVKSKQDEKDDEDQELDEAELEAKESGKLQSKQLQLLDEEDFLDAFAGVKTKKIGTKKKSVAVDETSVKFDVSKLSKREKVKLFDQESPEFDGIADDFDRKMNEARLELLPIVEMIDAGQIPDGPAAEYVKSKYRIMLSYCTNISCYLMFKSRRTPLKFHPVTERLVQYKKMLDQMDASDVDRSVMDQVRKVRSQMEEEGKSIDELVKRARKRAKAEEDKKTRSTPKRLRLLDGPPEIKNTKRDQLLTGDEQMAIEMFEATQNKRKKKKKEEEEETDESEEATGPVDEGEEGDEDNRRLITYQIQKNKGLTPKRSKLQRNPRVKHRHKFEKAKIRRKGAVREVRKENKKYGGEISGINARVKKGVKLA